MENLYDLKGRAKEAGDRAGDRHLKRDGQVARGAAKIKEILDGARGKVGDAIEKLIGERGLAPAHSPMSVRWHPRG